MASVEKRGKNYLITVRTGKDSAGKYGREYMTWEPPERMTPAKEKIALENAVIDFERKVKSGKYLSGEKITLAEFIEGQYWPNHAVPELKLRVREDYRDCVDRRIIPALGHLPIAKIQPKHILEWLQQLDESGMKNVAKCKLKPEALHLLKKNNLTAAKLEIASSTNTKLRRGDIIAIEIGEKVSAACGIPLLDMFNIEGNAKKLSANTKGIYYRVLSSIMTQAVQWQVIQDNPCRRVKQPREADTQVKSLELEDAQKAIAALNDYPDIRIRVIMQLLLETGIREAEAAGLEWKDIDFAAGMIHIRRTSQYVRRHGVVESTPKSRKSTRRISFSDMLGAILLQYQDWQLHEIDSLGDQWRNTDRLFTTWNGAPINNQTIIKWVKKFSAHVEIPYITVHGLRHTYASLQIAGGVDIRTVAGVLGHSQPSLALNIYAQPQSRAEREAAVNIEKLLYNT